MIEELAGKDAEVFAKFWADFGAVIKEGIHFESEHRDRISKIVRYESSTQPGLTSLGEYVSRMKDGQKAIYYATGTSRALLDSSPHLETLKKRGYEVLFMTDGVDPFAVTSLGEFDGKPLVSAMDENLELERKTERRAARRRRRTEEAGRATRRAIQERARQQGRRSSPVDPTDGLPSVPRDSGRWHGSPHRASDDGAEMGIPPKNAFWSSTRVTPLIQKFGTPRS